MAVPSAVTQLDTRDGCDAANAVPFYRSWSGITGTTDHFYTTDHDEMNNTIVNSCNTVTFEGTMGVVFRSPTVSATLLYRVYNAPQAL
ncbi:hypothetical protein FOMPIDRAFT_91610 [Fomitopsis schrenkii]|uniref:DUF5648 domain-containing protein n=1 Tax=Fomitopsis schrenkii TaxID=2126942 RepID=S8FU87_FOMSC|nr:hypothetical protein FOMPIDRAFT_91610 [Fomitopsis schrenkii]